MSWRAWCAYSSTYCSPTIPSPRVVFHGEHEIWEGHTEGRLVDSRGQLGGWTPVLEVKGTGQTLGEMSFDDRMRWTMRREPLMAARDWIATRTATGS